MLREGRRVKFNDDEGNIIFGVVAEHSSEVEGCVRVNHALLPRCYNVPPHKLTCIPFTCGNEYDSYIHAQFEQAKRLSASVQGIQVGKRFSVPVADGFANYVITKVTASQVHIEWRGFHPDRYVAAFGWGGAFRKIDIALYVAEAEAQERLVARLVKVAHGELA